MTFANPNPVEPSLIERAMVNSTDLEAGWLRSMAAMLTELAADTKDPALIRAHTAAEITNALPHLEAAVQRVAEHSHAFSDVRLKLARGVGEIIDAYAILKGIARD